jgi:hypothetical protein
VRAPAQDNTIYEEATGNSNGAGKYLFVVQTAEDNGIPASLRRALVAFDLAVIPANAIVDSVQVEFTINNEPGFAAIAGFADLHRITKGWGEGSANAAGGDFEAVPSGTEPFGAGFESCTCR